MSNYTPGPWEPRWITSSWITIAPVGQMESVTEIFYNHSTTGRELSVTDIANARLIAAAPDLLKALRGLFKNCAMTHRHWGENSNQKDADAAITDAHAAIAKANEGASIA